MANEWRVERAQQKQARTALRSIRQELQTNLDQVRQLLPYHRSMKQSLDPLVAEVFDGGARITPAQITAAMPRGFSVPVLERTAWDLANRTGAVADMDYELASDLSRLYTQQAFYQEKLGMIPRNFYIAGNIDTKDLGASAVAMDMLANDILIQEEQPVAEYPLAIERIDEWLR